MEKDGERDEGGKKTLPPLRLSSGYAPVMDCAALPINFNQNRHKPTSRTRGPRRENDRYQSPL